MNRFLTRLHHAEWYRYHQYIGGQGANMFQNLVRGIRQATIAECITTTMGVCDHGGTAQKCLIELMALANIASVSNEPLPWSPAEIERIENERACLDWLEEP